MNSPFEGITEIQKNKLFKLLHSNIYFFNKNEEILSIIKNDNIMCILLEGTAQIININYNGEETLIERLEENSIFGSNISDTNNIECHIQATSNCKVLIIDYSNLINTKNINYPYYNLFICNLFNIINSKIHMQNNRIRVLTQKSIRNKLLAFFENEYKKNHSKIIYIPNNLKDLADYLSINRSAMFRELRYLKDDKFIKVDGKKIILLYTPSI